MKETWRQIKGYEDIYTVSDYGRVANLITERILKPVENHKGYLIVQLSKDGKRKNFRVHRLVAEAFIPNPKKLPEVDHINNDRQGNHVSNLRWSSGSENTRNREVCRTATSKYNGVRICRRSGKWKVSIWFNNTTKHLGTFADEVVAAKAFNDFCRENNLNRELNIL